MLEATTSIVQALQTSKQVLFVMHEYLPLPLALWVPSIVSLLKKQGKDITVLVSQDVFGWPKRVDEVYPTDMVLALEQLRQVISIPITHKSETIGDVSYDVSGGNLQITVVPVKETLDMSQITTVTHGKNYDVVIGVGVSSNHATLSALSQSKASLSQAKGFFLGTYTAQASLAEKLSFIPTVSVLDSQEDKLLREILQQLTQNTALEPQQRELVTLFVQSIVSSTQQFEYLDKDGYEYLGRIADESMDSGRMASLYSGDFASQNRILQQILKSAQKSSTGELLLFTVSASQVQQLGVSVQDIVTALYYLPKYPQVKQVIVIIEENATRHHVYVNGVKESVKQVAIKFGFPRTDRLTGGLVEGVLLEKLSRDLTRITGKEELIPENVPVYANTNMDVVPAETQPKKPATMLQPKVEVQESPSLPVEKPTPNLDEVLANTTMTNGVELESTNEAVLPSQEQTYTPEIQPSATETINSIPAPTPVTIPQPSAPSVDKTQKAPTGLDFAAIAKKMRESIT